MQGNYSGKLYADDLYQEAKEEQQERDYQDIINPKEKVYEKAGIPVWMDEKGITHINVDNLDPSSIEEKTVKKHIANYYKKKESK